MEYYEERDFYPETDGIKVKIDLTKSEIRKSYTGANVFITGGAGFLGSLLIEKIARSCPDFGKIYLLLRPKRGMTTAQRLEKIFEDQIFDQLKRQNPSFIERIHVVEGDLVEEVCGLSEENQQILREEINYVFHVAACLRMAEPLMTAYKMNLRATKDLLDLATTMHQLKGFVYVSTAYSNCHIPEISESFYKPPYDWKDLEDFAKVTSEEQLSALEPKLRGPWVNNYAFTKAITEDMIQLYVDKIPVTIARPSIVIGCATEPLRNWINNVYGVTGVTAAACTGLMRVWYADGDKVADIIPADYVINTMIAISWKIGEKFEKKEPLKVPIFNIVSSPKVKTTWGEYTQLTSYNAIKSRTPYRKSIGEYAFMLVSRKWLFFLLFYILHLGQGIILDTILLLKGKEPMLLKAYNKIMRFNLSLAFFSENEWKYTQSNVDKLLGEMNDDDKKLFPFDMAQFDWREYHIVTVRAIYKYIVKAHDDVEDSTFAQIRYSKFVIARKCIVRTIKAVLLYYGIKYIGRATIHYAAILL